MSASSSGSRTHDVFPSFRGEDVRDSFLSHLLKALNRKSILTFSDNGIERSRPIGPELLSAIREAKISIVIFSKSYASSTWCLDELVEIHKGYMELGLMVIPIFYNVDPSEVKKQSGEFLKVFKETCEDKTEDQIQKWKQALTNVAILAGEHLKKGVDEAFVVEKIANDVSNKLITSPSNYSDGLVGIEAHIKAMNSKLCLKSENVRMVGIVGPSGIGKSTIGRELFTQLSSQFIYRVFETYRKTNQDNCRMKLSWAQQFLSEILGQKDIEVLSLGEVEQRLKDKKVLIVLDDVDNLELLETLVGEIEWFGSGSRIIVITQDKHLLTAHEIDLIYEVELPSKTLALEMLCRSAFKQNFPPDGFMEVTVEVAKLAGNLPLGLNVLGSSLRKRGKNEWMEMLPRLQNILEGDIGKQLRVSYDRLNKEDQLLFLYIACHFNRCGVHYIQRSLGDTVSIGLKMLTEKSLLRITSNKTVEMHDLLVKLGREIFRAESSDPGKRRFLVDVDDIRDVLTYKTGTETVHGIILNASAINEPISIHKKSFERMHNLQIINLYATHSFRDRLDLPKGLVSLPRYLRVLKWKYYPGKSLPSTFKAEFLVKLIMSYSKLEKLWDGTLSLGNLRVMNMSHSEYLEVIPNLSKAINLEELHLSGCLSLVTYPSSIQILTKLRMLNMYACEKLEYIPTFPNLDSLKYLDLRRCSQLRNFPRIFVCPRKDNAIAIEVEDCLWGKNLSVPRQFRLEHTICLSVEDCVLEKLWEGIQSLGSLVRMDLSECLNLIEFPDLSKATNLEDLILNDCKSLVKLPSTIGNLQKLKSLSMRNCKALKSLPMDVNLSSLKIVDFSGCSRLSNFPKISSSIKKLYLDDTTIERVPCFIKNLQKLRWLSMRNCTTLKVLPMDVNLPSLKIVNFNGCSKLSIFPRILTSIEELYLNDTAIEKVPCFIEDFSRIAVLVMRGCKRLKNISPKIFRLTSLKIADFADCGDTITALSDASEVKTMEENISCMSKSNWLDEDETAEGSNGYFKYINCSKLDEDARELILRSCFKPTVLPGGEVPAYFTHRASADSLTVSLPQSALSQNFLRFKACVILEPRIGDYHGFDLLAYFLFNGIYYSYRVVDIIVWLRETDETDEMDHLVLCSFKFRRPITFPSKLDFNDMELKFHSDYNKIRGCGLQVLNVSVSPDGSDGSSEIEYNQQSGGKHDVVESRRSKQRMLMTSRTNGEYFSLPCGQNIADTGLTAINLEHSLGQREASSVSSYPCMEREALYAVNMITEQQDSEIPILEPSSLPSPWFNPSKSHEDSAEDKDANDMQQVSENRNCIKEMHQKICLLKKTQKPFNSGPGKCF